MKRTLAFLAWLVLGLVGMIHSQQVTNFPRLIRFTGTLRDEAGQPRSGATGVTLALYAQPKGGSPLWLETQSVTCDANGRFAVLLGAEHAEGVPVELFASDQALWLGFRGDDGVEQPRVQLVSVPYALKAKEAESIGGMTADQIRATAQSMGGVILATNQQGTSVSVSRPTRGSVPSGALGTTPGPRGSVTLNAQSQMVIEAYDDAQNAPLQLLLNPKGGNVGVGTTTPGQKLSVAGTVESTTGGFKFPDATVQATAGISQTTADTRYLKLTGGTLTGALTAPSFTGSGAGLTGLKTTSLSGTIAPINLPGSTLGPSLQQIATLNWRGGAQGPQNFPAGTNPEGVAFDGTNIWVTNKGDNNVMKLRASDGGLVGTYAVGTQPYGVTFDGTNMWVANFGSNNVTKLSLAGATLGTFNVGTNPIRICYDGTNLWVTNYGSGTVTKLSAAGATLGTFAVGVQPYGIAFDGTNIWVSNNATGSNSITVLRAGNGAVVSTLTGSNLYNPEDIAFDGVNMWVTGFGSNVINKFRASDLTYLGPYNAGNANSSVAFDGSNIWVVSFLPGGGVNKVRTSDGHLISTQPTGSYPNSVAFDGSNIWTANYGSNTVTKIPLAGIAGDLTAVAAGDGSNLTNLGGNGAGFTNINANQLVSTTNKVLTTGNGPRGVASDGTNIWVANYNADTVQKFRASDGTLLDTIPLPAGTGPYGLAFDGANMWTSNLGTSTAGSTVTKIRVSNDTVVNSYTVGSDPYGITFDGTNIWVANLASNTVSKLDPATGNVVGTYNTGVGPGFLVSDGTNIWVTITGSNSPSSVSSDPGSVLKLKASDGTNLGSVATGRGTLRIAFDGASIWVVNFSENTVTKIRASDSVVLGTYVVGNAPAALAFDGSSMWVANDEFVGVPSTMMKLSLDGTKQLVLSESVPSFPIEAIRGMISANGSIWATSRTDNALIKITSGAAGTSLSQLAQGDGSGLGSLNATALTGTVSNANLAGVPLGPTPQQLAVDDWSWNNPTFKSFLVGHSPQGIAFDGANIWVTNRDDNTVTKLRASDGALQGTFAVGTQPYGIAFDGNNMWVANFGSNNVTKLRGSDGTVLGKFAVGTNPIRVCFDGTNIWVANNGSKNITKLKPADGSTLGTYAVGTKPYGVVYDGYRIWVANSSDNTVTALLASNGSVVNTYPATQGPQDLAFDGNHVWVSSSLSTNVMQINPNDGTVYGTHYGGQMPTTFAFDGANMWVLNYLDFYHTLLELRPSDGAYLYDWAAAEFPTSATFDGSNLWFTNSTTGTVYKFPAGVDSNLRMLAQGDGRWLGDLNAAAIGFGTLSKDRLDLGFLDGRYLQVSAPVQTLSGNLIVTGNMTTFSLNPHDLIVNTTGSFGGNLSAYSGVFNGSSANGLVQIVNSGLGAGLSVDASHTNTGAAIIGGGDFWGVRGAGGNAGVYGSSSNFGVWGFGTASSAQGVYGSTNNGTGIGVEGTSTSNYGVYGTSSTSIGVFGESGNVGILGHNTTAAGGNYAYISSNCCAADLYGTVAVHGTLSKAAGSFKIDHPLDPANKYLSHSFVESPDMMNIYNGNVTTDGRGYAVITLPDWFMALNKDFRYQLTVMGVFAQAIVDQEIANNHFRIRTNQPNVKVSWQVTGIRHDAYAVAHPIPVEEIKPGTEKGTYSYPELYGQPEEKSVRLIRHPERPQGVR